MSGLKCADERSPDTFCVVLWLAANVQLIALLFYLSSLLLRPCRVITRTDERVVGRRKTRVTAIIEWSVDLYDRRTENERARDRLADFIVQVRFIIWLHLFGMILTVSGRISIGRRCRWPETSNYYRTTITSWDCANRGTHLGECTRFRWRSTKAAEATSIPWRFRWAGLWSCCRTIRWGEIDGKWLSSSSTLVKRRRFKYPGDSGLTETPGISVRRRHRSPRAKCCCWTNRYAVVAGGSWRPSVAARWWSSAPIA